ncbi:TMEM143 family protein [[Phormidium] sp. ETS-05]|uniref:TMEM143 family protein n=1 Tax=[Phormidium] sp. ETS-05 TaxID=222819 RepID=UPI0018EEDA21|nr:TMEM143 family protein [[Phormidium] sp. ETS-05]
MAVYQNREAFIPYRRSDLVELCIQEGKLAPSDVQKFRDFCQILMAYYHFHFHESLEIIKDNYAPFNPDADTKFTSEPTPSQRAQMADTVIAEFRHIIEEANYFALTKDSLERAFAEKSLIDVKTNINLDDFEYIYCYCRGDIYTKITLKNFWIRQETKTINAFERVALLIKFKDNHHFTAQNLKLDSLNFTPGKIYVYIYKNIPKLDIELLFPNIKIGMTWKDRLLLGIPAVGAAIPLGLRLVPQLLLIVGIILYYTGIPGLEAWKANPQQVSNFMPVLAAMLSLTMTLGGFAFKQYNDYQNKRIKFQKKVTETLFFRNLANNASAFHALIDEAEEEQCKQIILVYYHLLTHNASLTPEQLDNLIEEWMDAKFGVKIDFDIHITLHHLETIRGKLVREGEDATDVPELPLLSYDEHGTCRVLPLVDARTIIDFVWDNAFR